MNQPRIRRLAAVWFADVVGYTSLSAKDEDAALAVIDELQTCSRRSTQDRGRIVKFIGDGVLAVFDSANDALLSAMELEESFANADVVREHGCSLSVGVHLGEVVEAEDGDIFGDGVNVAARIEELAGSRQILISEDVYRQIRNRPTFKTHSFGQHQMKGLDGPMTLYALGEGQAYESYDRVYVPVNGHTTGDLDIHDLAVDGAGDLVFVNTLFGCLATVSETHSFVPLWRPPFVSRLAAEDRCHLNGLAMAEGRPRYVTAVGETDVADAWRDHRQSGGVLVDVDANEVVLRGLSMPHSPRLHGGKVWLHDSGTGRFGHIDGKRGTFEPVAFCPGYLRGLAMVGDFAVAGLSRPRADNHTFAGLALDDALEKGGVEARCGLVIIDLRSGDIVHWLRIEGVVNELYDVAVLPGVQRPTALGFKTDEINRVITIGPEET